jgi:hypothetical protein
VPVAASNSPSTSTGQDRNIGFSFSASSAQTWHTSWLKYSLQKNAFQNEAVTTKCPCSASWNFVSPSYIIALQWGAGGGLGIMKCMYPSAVTVVLYSAGWRENWWWWSARVVGLITSYVSPAQYKHNRKVTLSLQHTYKKYYLYTPTQTLLPTRKLLYVICDHKNTAYCFLMG